MNVNYYDAGSSYIEEEQREQVRQFTEFSDYVVAASKYLNQVIEKQFPKKTVVLIEEAIPEKYFQSTVTPQNPPKTFLWVGFKWKVKELEVLKETLSVVARNHGIGLRTIGGTAVAVGDMQVDAQPYREWSVDKQMRGCDVFIAPRDLSDPYNLAHTFTKIGGAMAMGIPVVASPVPSYKRSPAIICTTDEDWNDTLTAIAAGKYDLADLGKRGSEYVWQNYHPQKIKADYKRLLKEIVTV
jgi:glycosyltransferase involved in cell wall biosynthesis